MQEIRVCAYLQGMTVFVARSHDLTNLRFASSPAWETEAAVRTFIDERSRPYHNPWHAAVAGRVSQVDWNLLFAVFPRHGWTPDFLTPPPRVPAPTLRELLKEIRSTPPRQVARELRRSRDEVGNPEARKVLDSLLVNPAASRTLLAEAMECAWRELVAPFWPRVRALLDADIAHRSRMLARHGSSCTQ